MSTPITVKHRTDDAEAMKFEGEPSTPPRDLAKWIQASSEGQRAEVRLGYELRLAVRAGEARSSTCTSARTSYELDVADWIVKENGLFSAVRREDFPLRYVTAIEKIMIEAGLS